MTFHVYVHMTPDLTPFYVGKGRIKRAKQLSPSIRNAWHGRVVAKYGRDSIVIATHECKTEQEAFYREQVVINSLKAKGIKLCNLTDGGEGSTGYIPTEEHKSKISEAAKGRKHSDEAKIRMSKGQIGRVFSAETRKKMAARQLGKPKSESARLNMSLVKLGKPITQESRRKISEALTGIKHSTEHKAKVSEARRGTVGISKGGEYRLVKAEVVELFISDGWKVGMPCKE